MVTIPALDKAAAELFLIGFLKGYIEIEDGQAFCAYVLWEPFVAAWCHWEPEVAVPFDMLSKYAEQAVRDFYVEGAGAGLISRGGSSGKIGRGGRLAQNYANESGVEDDFLRAVLDPSAVNRFIKEYAGGSLFKVRTRAPENTQRRSDNSL